MSDSTTPETGIVKLDQGITPATNNSDLLRKTHEAFRANFTSYEIPAVPGKESVKIMPKPVYFKFDHGGYSLSYDEKKDVWDERRQDTSYYASFAFLTGREIRFATIPVALFRDDQTHNGMLLADMAKQGFPQEAIRMACSEQQVEEVFGYLDSHMSQDFFRMMAEGEFEVQGYSPRAGTYVKSGWDEVRQRLTIVGKEFVSSGFRMNPYFDRAKVEKYNTGVVPISDPLTAETMGNFEAEVLARVLTSNKA